MPRARTAADFAAIISDTENFDRLQASWNEWAKYLDLDIEPDDPFQQAAVYEECWCRDALLVMGKHVLEDGHALNMPLADLAPLALFVAKPDRSRAPRLYQVTSAVRETSAFALADLGMPPQAAPRSNGPRKMLIELGKCRGVIDLVWDDPRLLLDACLDLDRYFSQRTGKVAKRFTRQFEGVVSRVVQVGTERRISGLDAIGAAFAGDADRLLDCVAGIRRVRASFFGKWHLADAAVQPTVVRHNPADEAAPYYPASWFKIRDVSSSTLRKAKQRGLVRFEKPRVGEKTHTHYSLPDVRRVFPHLYKHVR
jgi:hypothetical protein